MPFEESPCSGRLRGHDGGGERQVSQTLAADVRPCHLDVPLIAHQSALRNRVEQ